MQNYREVKLTRRARNFGFGYVETEFSNSVRVTPNYEGTFKEIIDAIPEDKTYNRLLKNGIPMSRAFFLNGKKILGVRFDRTLSANNIQEQFVDIYDMILVLHGIYGDICKSLIAYVEKEYGKNTPKRFLSGSKTLVEVFEEEARREQAEVNRVNE